MESDNDIDTHYNVITVAMEWSDSSRRKHDFLKSAANSRNTIPGNCISKGFKNEPENYNYLLQTRLCLGWSGAEQTPEQTRR